MGQLVGDKGAATLLPPSHPGEECLNIEEINKECLGAGTGQRRKGRRDNTTDTTDATARVEYDQDRQSLGLKHCPE